MDHLPLHWWFWCAHGLESIFPCKCGYLSPLIIDAMITACSKHATRKRKGVDSSSSSTLDGNEWGWFLAIGKTDQPHWCCICTIGQIAQKCGRIFTSFTNMEYRCQRKVGRFKCFCIWREFLVLKLATFCIDFSQIASMGGGCSSNPDQITCQ